MFGIYGNQYLCNDTHCYITYGNNRKNNFIKIEKLSQMNIPLLTLKDLAVLDDIAELFKPQLIEILNDKREYFLNLPGLKINFAVIGGILGK